MSVEQREAALKEGLKAAEAARLALQLNMLYSCVIEASPEEKPFGPVDEKGIVTRRRKGVIWNAAIGGIRVEASRIEVMDYCPGVEPRRCTERRITTYGNKWGYEEPTFEAYCPLEERGWSVIKGNTLPQQLADIQPKQQPVAS